MYNSNSPSDTETGCKSDNNLIKILRHLGIWYIRNRIWYISVENTQQAMVYKSYPVEDISLRDLL